MSRFNISSTGGGRFIATIGHDHVLGMFFQLADTDRQDDDDLISRGDSGEGYILEWDKFSGLQVRVKELQDQFDDEFFALMRDKQMETVMKIAKAHVRAHDEDLDLDELMHKYQFNESE